ncbi:MAG: histidine--tRNA ligase [Bacteroidota bacterium]
MSRILKNITGTFDILPKPSGSDGAHSHDIAAWDFVTSTIRAVFARYDFHEIRTPILEPTELIARGVGQLTDIVSKEMFAFSREETNYVLRPEVTAPVMRAYLQHHLGQQGGVQKLFYIGPCFRAERPQKGRYRQFHQFGCEVIGADNALADAEVIGVMTAIYKAFGLGNIRLRINSLGDETSRPKYKQALRDYLTPHASDLSEISQKRLAQNPLRILDTKDKKERALLEAAPMLMDFVDEDSLSHYETVKSLLGGLDVAYVEDPFLVRGLDYYTRTAFELESDDLGAQSALAGGGRYDLLAKDIGGKKGVPAVGFAAGIERLLIALDAANCEIPSTPGPDVYLVGLGDKASAWAIETAQQLRKEGMRVAFDLSGRSLKAQMRDANRLQARFVVIVGENELDSGKANIKSMEVGEQQEIALDQVSHYINTQSSH